MEKEWSCAYLPDPFTKRDGTRIKNPIEWAGQAAYFRELCQAHMYGNWPGHPKKVSAKIVKAENEYDGRAVREWIELVVNDRYPLDMQLIRPAKTNEFPVITYNAPPEPALRCPIEEDVVTKAGYAIASFNREQIAPDHPLKKEEASKYPPLDCGAIMAWGWCHTIVADYLKSREDARELIATGHSRAGKAALCAGIFDERFAVVAPMGSGCGGAGSARFSGTADGKRQNDARCETIGSLAYHFPHWFEQRYADYGTKKAPFPLGEEVTRFPLDAHMLRAACAPRGVFTSEGIDDDWANGYGTQLAFEAAQSVFEFLGVPENNGFHVRQGGHAFHAHDWMVLIAFCDKVLGRECTMPHENTSTRFFAIDVEDFAPWA